MVNNNHNKYTNNSNCFTYSFANTMVPSAPAKILIGISTDPNDSQELLSWAIKVLAQPNDTIVAIHVLGQYV